MVVEPLLLLSLICFMYQTLSVHEMREGTIISLFQQQGKKIENKQRYIKFVLKVLSGNINSNCTQRVLLGMEV